ncbi:N5,N10-methylene tetrahydromethanopterin reductase [Actinosynnema sp. ALI-1.44]|uniref:LLM class flavin-dependent oxidoreductase n=1 Tax=Actinosynnema sp. ALI-1.44 TaxID=1933779 RepID=UPI00097BF850|nr:LLM class flavin-dependent oxidoreductase [Actinosynnema sp. ALI-1.44]ONI87907.1 N5,N10-methylene tetrahydromethanopterin reductase [Actinosynnema sp. ALI-1.44]
MDIAVALPSSVPGSTAQDLMDWSVEGERAGFSSLAVLDRLVYDNYDCLTTLAAAAALTSRVRLMTAILIGPLHRNAALLAKQAATVDRISGGRLTLGMAVGARPDDFNASGADHAHRGRDFTAQLEELRKVWAGERRGFAGAIGPAPTRPQGPELILGGHAPGAIARAVRFGDGWISGGGGLGMFRGGAGAFRAAWAKAGRTGKPRLLALAYFSLGDQAEENAKAYINDYYGFAPPYAQAVLANTSIGDDALAQNLRAYEEAGCDELVLVPCSADLDQIKRLGDVCV